VSVSTSVLLGFAVPPASAFRGAAFIRGIA
jgi:hypothetical protein